MECIQNIPSVVQALLGKTFIHPSVCHLTGKQRDDRPNRRADTGACDVSLMSYGGLTL